MNIQKTEMIQMMNSLTIYKPIDIFKEIKRFRDDYWAAKRWQT